MHDFPQMFPGNPSESPGSWRKSVLTVTELNRRARGLIEAQFELLWVTGEVSNVVRAASGHWYFALKDSGAQVRCVMFRQKAANIGFQLENGMQVEVLALPSLYEARGDFQLGVESVRRAGLGALFDAFLKLKQKLEQEGLFDEARKRPLPNFPRRLGIITSLKAAALKDVLATLARRAPMIELVIYPTAVQGAPAADEIVAALNQANERAEVDALILCRGGGSIEDLWPFNEEKVARAIAASQLPVVSGVGHETDFTIADFVADRRAPTPTAAAEMLSPSREALLTRVAAHRMQLARRMHSQLDQQAQRIDGLRRALLSPGERLALSRERLAQLQGRLKRGLAQQMSERRWALAAAGQSLAAARPDFELLNARLANIRRQLVQGQQDRLARVRVKLTHAAASMELLSPQRTLERGYAIALKADGRIVRGAADATAGEALTLRVGQGELGVRVESTRDAPITSDAVDADSKPAKGRRKKSDGPG